MGQARVSARVHQVCIRCVSGVYRAWVSGVYQVRTVEVVTLEDLCLVPSGFRVQLSRQTSPFENSPQGGTSALR